MILFFTISGVKLSFKEKVFAEKLYLKESKRMWYTAVKILKNREMAEDAVHLTFENILKKTPLLMSLDPRAVSAYVFIATRNTANGFLRKEDKTTELTQVEFFLTDDNDDVALQVINQLEIDEIKKIIKEMNPTYSDPFYLRHFMGLDYKDIADTLLITVSVAHHRVSRARGILKDVLKARKRGGYDD